VAVAVAVAAGLPPADRGGDRLDQQRGRRDPARHLPGERQEGVDHARRRRAGGEDQRQPERAAPGCHPAVARLRAGTAARQPAQGRQRGQAGDRGNGNGRRRLMVTGQPDAGRQGDDRRDAGDDAEQAESLAYPKLGVASRGELSDLELG
jgi:hypothetical protein